MKEEKCNSPPKAEKKSASTGFFGNTFGGPKADVQVEESATGSAKNDYEASNVVLEPDSVTVNVDTEWNEHQDTTIVYINAPEEKHSDSADEKRSASIHRVGNAVQDNTDQEAKDAVSAAQVEEA